MSAVSFATSFATPLASSLAGGETVVWKGLVFTSLGTSTVYLDSIGGNNPNCEYSTNSGSTWVTFPTTGPALQFTGSLWVRGVNASGFNSSSSAYSVFVFNGSSINASGSVMSLIDGVGDSLVIPNDYCFYSLFKNCLQLTSAPELPATTLTTCCYHSMFRDCGGLTSTPNLPSINLADSCYESMFYHCIALTTATALPATTVLGSSYKNMFNGCTSLVNPPAISAHIVSGYSCLSMFEGCTALTYAPNLPATTLATACYQKMFFGCSSLNSAMATLPATSIAQSCYKEMFEDCTALTVAPSLPSTSLAPYCYENMFFHSGLTSSPNLTATTLQQGCYYRMFYNCYNLNEIHCSATDISASGCTLYWVFQVSASGAFYRNEDTWAGWETGISGIPSNWTVVPPAPTPTFTGLKFTSTGDSTISLAEAGTGSTEYSTDNGSTWNAYTSGTTLNMSDGESICWRGNKNSDGNGIGRFTTSGSIAASGDITSLLNQTGGVTDLSTYGSYLFRLLLYGCGITTPPSLPSTTLGVGCYLGLLGRSAITASPTLDATTLVAECYKQMFYGCPNISEIRCNATDISATDCTNAWVAGGEVPYSGDFYGKSAAGWTTGTSGIHSGWTAHLS